METNPQDFANSVIRLLEDEKLRETTGKKASTIIQDNFSWEKIASQLESYFS